MHEFEEFYLSQDNDGHWFVVPVEKEADWEQWLELDEDDETSWNTPEWVEMIGGSYTLVKFNSYRID